MRRFIVISIIALIISPLLPKESAVGQRAETDKGRPRSGARAGKRLPKTRNVPPERVLILAGGLLAVEGIMCKLGRCLLSF